MTHELGPIPDEAKAFLDEARAKADSNVSDDPKVKQLFEKIEELRKKYISPRHIYTIKSFKVALFFEHPRSIAELDVSDEIFADLVWTRTWDVPTIAKKISEGEFTEANLLPRPNRDYSADFETLNDAIKRWSELQSSNE